MRYHQDCHALVLVQGAQQVGDLAAALGIQVASRLVGEQDARPGDESPGDGRPLHLAAGEFARLVLDARPEADAVENLGRSFGGLATRAPPVEHRTADQGRHHHVLQGREFRKQMVELKNEAKRAVAQPIALARTEAVDALAVEHHRSRVRPVERAEQVEQRTLAGAGCPDDGEKLAALDVEIDALKDVDDVRVPAISLEQVLGDEHW